jgi:hypothetical protein
MSVLTVRLSDEELARIVRLQERLQEREGAHVRVTQRVTLLRAMDALEKHLDRLDRDKGRDR